MAEYPAKRAYRGKGPWEKEAIRLGFVPRLDLGARVWAAGKLGKVTAYDLRIVDPPTWHYQVNGLWYSITELERAKHG